MGVGLPGAANNTGDDACASYPSPVTGRVRRESAGGGAMFDGGITPPDPPPLLLRRATLPFQGRDKTGATTN